jgi:hypothetical protein
MNLSKIRTWAAAKFASARETFRFLNESGGDFGKSRQDWKASKAAALDDLTGSWAA